MSETRARRTCRTRPSRVIVCLQIEGATGVRLVTRLLNNLNHPWVMNREVQQGHSINTCGAPIARSAAQMTKLALNLY